jgi:hypothetical protein
MNFFKPVQGESRRLWMDNAPLTATMLLMLAALVVSVAGIVFDPRIITGMPAWLKPAKFAISTAIYAGTMAWLFRYIQVWPRFVRAMGWIIGLVLVLEVVIIDVQAARGTTSHFNIGTTIDFALWSIIGSAIALLWLASVGILIALFRQNFSDRTWGWSLRLGMLITVLGAASGGLTVRPTPAQVDSLRAGQAISAFGGHTVGAPDGGPGLPGVGWSTQHGDLRVPHFFGLHAIQFVPFCIWAISRRRGWSGARLAWSVAFSYFALIGILTWQALHGQSIVQPDQATLAALGIWCIGTAMAVIWSRERSVKRGLDCQPLMNVNERI